VNRLVKAMIAKQVSVLIRTRGLDFYLDYYAKNIHGYDAKEGKKFKTTAEEVDDFIKDVKELSPAREQLIQLTRNARIKANLPE
jgi:hypothetical protein